MVGDIGGYRRSVDRGANTLWRLVRPYPDLVPPTDRASFAANLANYSPKL